MMFDNEYWNTIVVKEDEDSYFLLLASGVFRILDSQVFNLLFSSALNHQAAVGSAHLEPVI